MAPFASAFQAHLREVAKDDDPISPDRRSAMCRMNMPRRDHRNENPTKSAAFKHEERIGEDNVSAP